MLNYNFEYHVFQINSLKTHSCCLIQVNKKSILMRYLSYILFSNIQTDVKYWSIFFYFKDWHIQDWYIINNNDRWILKTDTYSLISKMDTLKITLHSTWGENGYVRLMYIKLCPRTDLTKVFPNI